MSLHQAIAGEVRRQLASITEIPVITAFRSELPQLIKEEITRQLSGWVREQFTGEMHYMLHYDRDFRHDLLKLCAAHAVIEDAIIKMLEKGAWVDQMANMVEKAMADRLKGDEKDAAARAEITG